MKISNTLPVMLGLSAVFLLAPVAEAAKENFERTKPHVNIAVSINGEDFGAVEGLSGLGVEVLPNGGSKGRITYKNITLKRGYTGSTVLQDWAAKAAGMGDACQDCRRSIKVNMLSRSGEVVRVFNLVDAFPVSWEISSKSSGKGDVAVEAITLRFDTLITD